MLGDYSFKKVKYVQEISDHHELIDILNHIVSKHKENELSTIDQLAALFFYVLNASSPTLEANDNEDFDEELIVPSNNPYWKAYYFKYLCRLLKLDCEIKVGHVRQIKDHVKQIRTVDMRSNHLWNTISLDKDSNEYLCDLTWSSINRPNDYFMVPKELSLLTHVSLDLLDESTKYLHLPIITDKCRQMFVPEKSNDFQPINIKACPNSGKCYLILENKLKDNQHFWHNVYYCPFQSESEELLQTYRKYVLLEVNSDCVNIYWRLPKSGIYVITLFYCNSSKFDKPDISNLTYEAIYSVRVECTKDISTIHPFVGCNTMSYGVCNSLFKKFKLSTINFHNGVVKSEMMPPALLEIAFNKAVTPKLSIIVQVRARKDVLGKDHRTLTFHYFPSQNKLDSIKLSDDEISHQYTGIIANELIDDEDKLSEEITFTVRIPKLGEYAVEVLCSPTPDLPKPQYVSIAQYFIDMTIKNPLFA